jgi:hypothetical protein
MHEYEAIIAKLPDSDAPAVFGLPDNIERRSVVTQILLSTSSISLYQLEAQELCLSSVMRVLFSFSAAAPAQLQC